MIKCQYCKGCCKKDGMQKNGMQKYRCKGCGKYQQETYKYQGKVMLKRDLVVPLLVNNCGFRGIRRVLSLALNTIKKIILTVAEALKEPALLRNGVYEMDEMKAYGKKGKEEIWAVYAVERKTGNKSGISVGKRDKQTLKKSINKVLIALPKTIYTDGYRTYAGLIPAHLHKVSKKMLWRVERTHLNARNSLKMLNRKTLAFVRKPATLLACLKLLFWSRESAFYC